MPRPNATACSREGRGRPGSSSPVEGAGPGRALGRATVGSWQQAAGRRRWARPQRSPPHAPAPGAGVPAGAGAAAEGRPPSPCSSAVRRARARCEVNSHLTGATGCSKWAESVLEITPTTSFNQ